MMQAVDEGVGRMLAALEESGQLDDTVFVFTSDEGYFFGEHGLSFERRLAYEESIRVPLLVRYPRMVRRGSTVEAAALNIDIAPTLLELAGVAAPPMHGRSLAPLLGGEKPAWRRSFLVEYFSDKVFPRVRNMGYQCVRTQRWKYIRYTELSGMDELYDLAEDPYEMRNLAGAPAARGALEAARRELAELLRASAS
jgi:N-acetylglucosamine-6-sulfatase